MRLSNVRGSFRNRRAVFVDHGERRLHRRQDDQCGDQVIGAPRTGFARRKIGHRQVVARVVDVLGLRFGRAAAAVMLAARIRIRRTQAEREPLKSRHREKEKRQKQPQPCRGLSQQAFSFPENGHVGIVPRNRPRAQPKLSEAYFLGSAISFGLGTQPGESGPRAPRPLLCAPVFSRPESGRGRPRSRLVRCGKAPRPPFGDSRKHKALAIRTTGPPRGAPGAARCAAASGWSPRRRSRERTRLRAAPR